MRLFQSVSGERCNFYNLPLLLLLIKDVELINCLLD